MQQKYTLTHTHSLTHTHTHTHAQSLANLASVNMATYISSALK